MGKFSPKEKIQIVKQYVNGIDGGKRLPKSLETHSSVIYQWIKQYEAFGEAAFEKRYTTYSLQYKLDVLKYMDTQGTSIRETAVIFNISSPGRIRKWRIQLHQKGVDALKSKKKVRQSMTKDNQKSIKKQTQNRRVSRSITS